MKKPIAALIAISALILSLTASLANAQPSPPTGVFDLLPAGDPLPSPVPSNVKGFSVRENWADISSSCPTGPGSYNWGNMDTDIQQAVDNGYEVLLSIGDSPNQAPDWVCSGSNNGGTEER